MASRFRRELTVRQLRALAAVHRDRSVTAAAKKLHLTQPAVTLQIRNLQALAGLPLIQRTTDGMLLTDAGREVLALSDRIEAALADCEATLEMMAGKSAGRVSIGAVSTAKYFVPFAISGFSKLYPDVDVMLSIGNRQEIGTALRGYDLDFAIMGRPPADIDMDVHLIGDHPHVIIAPTAHRLARKAGIALTELASETFLTREPGSGTRGLMEQRRPSRCPAMVRALPQGQGAAAARARDAGFPQRPRRAIPAANPRQDPAHPPVGAQQAKVTFTATPSPRAWARNDKLRRRIRDSLPTPR